tara:strand:- start:2 stop:325 length:324 start_codon:yes stop_codon:yes gene_type:complete
MSFDSNEIVTNIVEKYIKPEYPIYRVTFINSYLGEDYYNPELLTTKIFTRLMEAKQCTCHNEPRLCLSKEGAFIHPNIVEEFINKNIYLDNKNNSDHVTIIKIKQIA